MSQPPDEVRQPDPAPSRVGRVSSIVVRVGDIRTESYVREKGVPRDAKSERSVMSRKSFSVNKLGESVGEIFFSADLCQFEYPTLN